MSDVQFEEEESYTPRFREYGGTNKGITGFLLKKGIVTSEKQANTLLLITAIIIFCISIFIFFYGSHEATVSNFSTVQITNKKQFLP